MGKISGVVYLPMLYSICMGILEIHMCTYVYVWYILLAIRSYIEPDHLNI